LGDLFIAAVKKGHFLHKPFVSALFITAGGMAAPVYDILKGHWW